MWLLNDYGFSNAFRIAHVFAAVMWMGLLWFFNFVQVPAFAEMDPAARNNALDKLTWRALWWFRWAAAATLILGIMIVGALPDGYFPDGDAWAYWSSPSGAGLLIAIIFAFIMAANVWMVIWPKQQIVIANARNVQGGGDANPDAPAAGRAGLMASRQNTIFSFPVLFFMLASGHVFPVGGDFDFDPSGTNVMIYLLLGIVVAVVMELNALGKISGRGNGGMNMLYETHKNAMYTGLGLILFFYVVAEVLLAN